MLHHIVVESESAATLTNKFFPELGKIDAKSAHLLAFACDRVIITFGQFVEIFVILCFLLEKILDLLSCALKIGFIDGRSASRRLYRMESISHVRKRKYNDGKRRLRLTYANNEVYQRECSFDSARFVCF